MKKFLILFIAILSFALESNATHLMGGEIIWKCVGNGKYQFTVRLYRECGGFTATLPTTVTLSTNAPVSIVCPLISSTDVSPDCYNSNYEISCGTTTPGGTGAIQMGIYKSGQITMSGSPPAGGWWFQWGSCCRPGSIDNVTSSSFMERAIMYPYTNPVTGSTQNANPCYDNSPDFLEDPKVVACDEADIVYNNLGYDQDLDSLYYDWAPAMQSGTGFPGPVAVYATGYAFNNPLPNSNQNANNTGAQLDNVSGQVRFTSYTQGSFATVLKVEEWRCGQLIGEVFRDIPIVVRDCTPNQGLCPQSSNNPPSIELEVDTVTYPNAPAVDSVTNAQGQILYYQTTVYAREKINFKITSFDNDFRPDCLLQNISFKASGGNLSSSPTYGNPNICLYSAPCATISSLNGIPPGSGGFVSTLQNNVEFEWQTDCNHLTYQAYSCGSIKSVYEFYFRMEDDACPTPGFSYATYRVNVLNYPPIPPDLSNACVTLDDATGNVDFDWVAPVDTGINFDYYVIYRATSATGTYGAVDTIFDYNTTSYTHTGVGNGPGYYFMRTAGGCDLISEPSDTIALMQLNLNPIPPTQSYVAQLSWNSHNTGGTNGVYYQIWRRIFPTGTWDLVDSTQALSYNDTVNLCSEDLEYQIRINNSCHSTTDHALFSDQINNDVIKIDSVSVVGSLANLSWQPTTETDAVNYIILYDDPGVGAWVAIDTVPVGTPMPYVWNGSQALQRSERFVVVTMDSCGNQSSELSATPHKTMHLSVATDGCEGFTRLRWNDYEGWGGTINYDVLVDITDNNGQPVATGALLNANGTSTTYKHTTLINGYEYCYYIRARDTSGLYTSTSNIECVSSLVVEKSKLLYLASTNVRTNGSIELYTFIDKTADVLSFSIERANDPLGPYLTVGTVPKPSGGASVVKYSDYTALPDENRYFYRISATDSCGAQDTVSNYGTNLLLEVTRNGNLSNTLVWNRYREYMGEVGKYEVYRMVDNDGNWTLVTDQLTKDDTTYVDNIRPFGEGDGQFCYFVVGVEASNPLGFVDENGGPFTSRSNNACVIHDARVFIPSAFSPNSEIAENRIWKPTNVFAQPNSYILEVYNRWGDKIFSTTNPDEGWDGMVSGGIAPMGVFTYFIKYKSLNGLPIEERGSFNLLR